MTNQAETPSASDIVAAVLATHGHKPHMCDTYGCSPDVAWQAIAALEAEVKRVTAESHRHRKGRDRWERRAEVAEAEARRLTEEAAELWDHGYASGSSNAMRRMSDEPNAPMTPNPHRAALATAGEGK